MEGEILREGFGDVKGELGMDRLKIRRILV